LKILLDECLPLDFRRSFVKHDAQSVQWAGLKSKKNGELLKAAEIAGFDVLISVDQGLAFQQSPTGRKLSVIVVRSPSNRPEDLLPLVGAILRALENIQPGEVL
jgi:hypothetical protein